MDTKKILKLHQIQNISHCVGEGSFDSSFSSREEKATKSDQPEAAAASLSTSINIVSTLAYLLASLFCLSVCYPSVF